MRVLFIDLHNMIHRCYHTDFSNSQYGAVYSFVRTLRSTIELFSPNKVIVVTEGHPKFRHELYPEYKAQRVEKNKNLPQDKIDSFKLQKNKILNIIKFLPIEFYKHMDYECDDVISSLIKKVYLNEENIIVSGDNDYLQLVSDTTKLYNPIKKVFVDKPEHDIILVKALAGDISDNIKGIPRVGEKTAIKIIKDEILRKKYLTSEDNLNIFNRNIKLVTFADVPLEELMSLHITNDFNKIKNDFIEMNFNSFMNDKTWDKFVETFDNLNH